MKYIVITILVFLILFATAEPISAGEHVVSSSAQIIRPITSDYRDYRERILRNFLMSHNSPMADYANNFIYCADKYNIDWRLVPAIAGVESTFGKRIPANSYNAYGWNNGKYSFDSWTDSIEVVSKALRENYYDKGATSIDRIARRYAPPSNTWNWKVKYFMYKIDNLPLQFTL
jgi:hypothetical protein